MYDFDVILGMDWLSNHQVSMDCFTKKIVFKKSGYPNLEFEGDRRILPTFVISALEAKRLLHKECKTYLTYVVDKSTPKITWDSVLLVREFPDVLLEDLLGLPLDRELKFKIKLLPGLAPISIPPYRMAPVELKELKTHL